MTDPTKNPIYRSTILRDSGYEHPSLWMEVFVLGDMSEERAFAEMLVRADCTRAKSLEKADLVIFTGGEDVNPKLYGEDSVHIKTFFDDGRDASDMDAWTKCVELGIPMFGVCRGAQFLHVMNGGRLFQDVDNHNGAHKMWDVRQKKMLDRVSSVHHQACIKNVEGGMEVIGLTNKSSKRYFDATEFQAGNATDIEAYFYRDSGCFGVQGHPEYRGYNEYTIWCLKMLEELFINNPDFEMRDNYRRMKLDIMAERDEKWAAINAEEEERREVLAETTKENV